LSRGRLSIGDGRRGASIAERKRLGPGGLCVCPKFGDSEEHIVANPCYKRMCPHRHTILIRK